MPTLWSDPWWWWRERRGKARHDNGVLLGATSAVLAHHLTWYLMLLSVNVKHYLLHEPGPRPLDPILGFFAVLGLTVPSLVMLGLVTVPYGMLAAHFLTARLRRAS